MKITDMIYGEADIDERLVSLMEHPAVQRLQGVHQNGADYMVDPRRKATRFEHSVGVMMLLKNLGASVDEQAAGLLHDISHTVFSHTIDILMKNQEQDFHENKRLEYLGSTDLIETLKDMGFDAVHIISPENFPLLDSPMPDLCADRIDYLLRDMFNMERLTREEVDTIVRDLEVSDGRMVIKKLSTGRLLVRKFVELNEEVFFDPRFEAANAMLADILRKALRGGVLNMVDLFSEDEIVLKKIRDAGYSLKNIGPDIATIKTSIPRLKRVIDPMIKVRTSKIDKASRYMIDRYLEKEKTIPDREVK